MRKRVKYEVADEAIIAPGVMEQLGVTSKEEWGSL